jgi:hypothetical protein
VLTFVTGTRAWGAEPEVIIAERLHRLDVLRPPLKPAPTRIASDAERGLLWAWLQAFRDEAVPSDPLPDRASLDTAVDEGRVVVGVPDAEPVAYAAVSPSLMRTARTAGTVARSRTRRARRCDEC